MLTSGRRCVAPALTLSLAALLLVAPSILAAQVANPAFPSPLPFVVPVGGGTGVAVASDGSVWVAGQVFTKVTPDGTRTPFQPPQSVQPYGMTPGPDGAMWFLSGGPFYSNGDLPSTIGRITPGGTFTAYSLPDPNSMIGGLTAGPLGDLWFTDMPGIDGGTLGSDAIGSVTPSGQVTEYPLGNVAGSIWAIAAAPDDQTLWATNATWSGEQESGNLIRYVPGDSAATIIGLPEAPSCDSQPIIPAAIAAGPDGDMWFTYSTARQCPDGSEQAGVGQVTPDGGVNLFPDPSGYTYDTSSSAGIAVGTNGDLWVINGAVSGDGVHVLWKLTPGGQFTGYDLEWDGSDIPEAIATAPGGRVWYIAGGDVGWISESATTVSTPPLYLEGDNVTPTALASTLGARVRMVVPTGGRAAGIIGILHGEKVTRIGTIRGEASSAGTMWLTVKLAKRWVKDANNLPAHIYASLTFTPPVEAPIDWGPGSLSVRRHA